MMSAPICKGCGRPARGTYVTALGTTWHPEHFRCVACGNAIGDGSFYQHQQAPYHPECYRRHVAPRCAYCARPLTGHYVVDHWGTTFCPEHQRQYPECRFCGRLVSSYQNGNKATDGEIVRCRVCRASAVESTAQAQPIFTCMVRWVNSQGLRYNDADLRLGLRDPSTLAQGACGSKGSHTLGTTLFRTHTFLGYNMRTDVKAVLILRGLPATLFQGVAVHELGHVWLAIHGVISLPDWGTEGFCEQLAHRLYRQMGTAESRYYATTIKQSTDPIYGDGFRCVRALAERIGFRHLVETLRTTKRLPTVP